MKKYVIYLVIIFCLITFVVYNKKNILIENNEKILINKEITPLSKNRDKLIETLKLIKDKCESLNNEKINNITKKFKNKPIIKVLKK